MNNEPNKTELHITAVALGLFMKQGMKKTSLDDIARAAGLTRVTLYRYFPQREQLVQAAFQHILTPLQAARDWVASDPNADIDAVLESIAQGLAPLPRGDLSACLVELEQIYPALYESFSQSRREALKFIFDRLLRVAEQQNRLRPGLNRVFVEFYFMEMVIRFLDHPAPQTQELAPAEFFTMMKNLFLYGILKEK